jgi:Tfp pilus assembly protein PilZ
MPFTLANRQWILSQDYSFGHAMIQNIRTDGTTGNLIIEEPAWVEEWSPDYTVYMPFVLNSNQYFLTVNTVNGNANIRQISINAKGRMRVSEPVWTATRWNTDYRVYMPFVLNGNQYFLTANAGKGNADIRQISLDASGKVMVSEPVWIATRWNTDYTAYMPFVLNGNQYFLIANPGSGDANICQIGLDASGKVVVSAPVWIATRWNTDYTVYIPFVLNGGQYFLTTNPAKGDADIRQISLDASGKIMVGNAIWSAARWNVNYTLNAPFELNGTQYFLSVNNAKAQQNVRPIRATAHGVSVLDPVWTLP